LDKTVERKQGSRLADYVAVAKVGDFREGLVRTFEVDGDIIGVVSYEGKFHAFQGVCTHEAYNFDWTRVAPGDDFSVIVCSSHFAVFRLDTGECLEFPDLEPRDLPVYSVRVEGEDVLVSKG
jgi:nitrite reductase/ring-hydroxylating ferredoxin subunit